MEIQERDNENETKEPAVQPSEIIVKGDGIYLLLRNNLESGKPSRLTVMQQIEKFGVQDIEFSAIKEIFTRNEDEVTLKISANPKIYQEPEVAAVEVDRDGLEATITFAPAVNGGETATTDTMKRALATANVIYGIDEAMLETLGKSHKTGEPYVVAKGFAPVEGTDGYLDFQFDIGVKTRKPKEREDGTVDFRRMDLFEMVTLGDHLVSTVAEVPGIDGMDVHNIPIKARKVKVTPNLPQGKGTVVTGEGTMLFAEISGQVVYDGKRVTVLPVLEIPGNVDNGTGNIDFNGGVVVRGNVLTGFSIVADGDIEIFGVVEGATITSKANIRLNSGVQGQDKAVITAKDSIIAKFAEGCTLIAGNDIEATSVMHSNISCDGHLKLTGKKSLLVGGKICVGKTITVATVGSNMATFTQIEVGLRPEVFEAHKLLVEQYHQTKAEFDKMDVIVQSLSLQNEKEPLPEAKKQMLLKCIHAKRFLREKWVALQKELDEMAPQLARNVGSLSVEQVIRAGVKLTIGNAVMFIRDDIQFATFRNVDAKIVIGPYE